jgi:hypothetical protein
MAFLGRTKVLLAKRETAYGTDAAPVAAEAMRVRNLTFTPLEAAAVARDLVKAWLGGDPLPLANKAVRLTCEVEFAGAGGADTPPAYGTLLRACGLSETITATTKVEYKPVSSGFESATLYFHHAGTRHKVLGARGTVELQLNRADVPRLAFDFTGIYDAPSAAAMPTPVFTGFQPPRVASQANTGTFTLHGFAPVVESLTLRLGNSVVFRDLVNSKVVEITDRAPGGSITVESPAIGTKDYFAAVIAETLDALAFVHGAGAGAVVQGDAPKVQLMNPRYGESDGISSLTLDLHLTPNAGNDEIVLTTK